MAVFYVVLMLLLIFNLGSCLDFELLQNAYRNEIQAITGHVNNNQQGDGLPHISAQVVFYLHKKDLDTNDVLLVNASALLNRSHFDFRIGTKFIIHGWMDSSKGPMATTVLNGFLKGDEDLNLIVVDWSMLSMDINYLNSAKRTEDVGAYVAEMIDFLVSKGAQLEGFHVIGHSLGGHVAGSIGASLRSGKLPRITGLDPALPGFEKPLIVAKKISTSDAEFVDCIHTAGGTLGIYKPICHADFYANGGRFNQPGCSAFDFGICSHFRAFEYFAESISRNHIFTSLRCNLYDGCLPSSVRMGYFLNNRTRGAFYVRTNSQYPFAPIVIS